MSEIAKPRPTIGRIVIYHTTESERRWMKANGHNVATTLPAMVCGVHDIKELALSGAVNLRVFYDGAVVPSWVESALNGEGEGQWSYPVIQK